MLVRKYNQHTVYVHNLSKFDGVFLLKNIMKLVGEKNIKCTDRDGQIINITLLYGIDDKTKKKYRIKFRDSYLIYPSSLKKLTSNIVDKKGAFPYEFFNLQSVNLNYIGKLPEYIYYKTQINLEEYNNMATEYVNDNWSIREQVLKYCIKDVKSLHTYIIKGSKELILNWNLVLTDFPTRPSLAKGIFRAHFYDPEKNPIALIGGGLYDKLKPYLSGGDVNVFKFSGKNLYHYDVNSIYPFVIKNYDMPVGKFSQFDGNILETIDLKDFFGFARCLVTAPDSIKIPALSTSFNNTRVFPEGQWLDYLTSETIKRFTELGYKFEILDGYITERGKPFDDFVSTFHKKKNEATKGTYEYTEVKLTQNSLWGSIAINPQIEKTDFIKTKDYETIVKKGDLKICKIIGDYIIIKHFPKLDKDTNTSYLNINVAIGAIITSCARVELSKYTIIENIKPYYIDTDSIITDTPLPDEYIGKELGIIVLERKYEEAVFLAPKAYSGTYWEKNKTTGETELKENTKVKGYINKLPFNEIKSLLNQDSSLNLSHEKWIRNVQSGEITIKDQIYTLKVNNNKSNLIYDNDGMLIGNKPFVLKYNKTTEMNEIV